MLRNLRSAVYNRLYNSASGWHEFMNRSPKRLARNLWWGRKLYGNDVGFIDNFRGSIRMRGARVCSGYRSPNPAATAKHVQELRETGYTILTGLFDAPFMKKLYAN